MGILLAINDAQFLEADPMATTGRDRPSFGTRGLIFALILTFIFYLLVSDMVSHRFFSGGAPDSPKTLQSSSPFRRAVDASSWARGK